jgi:LmbE family N-acetylglucosaminyl deacetylase
MHLSNDIIFLIENYLTGTIKAEERLLLDQWYNLFANDKEEMFADIKDEQETKKRIQQRIAKTIALYKQPAHKPFFRGWWLPVIGASLILILLSIVI